MGQCLGPCDGLQSKEEYAGCVDDALDFLKGKNKALETRLREQMEAHSEAMEFEQAAKVRDQIRAIESVFEQQWMASIRGGEQDILGLHRKGDKAHFRIFFVRGGRLLGDQGFTISAKEELPDAEIVSSFVKQYYIGQSYLPGEVLLPVSPPDAEVITQWLSERRGQKVEVACPRRGGKRRLVEMACENAVDSVEREAAQISKDQATLEEIRKILRMESLPVHIEAFDISNMHGSNIVGASVDVPGRAALKRWLPALQDSVCG